MKLHTSKELKVHAKQLAHVSLDEKGFVSSEKVDGMLTFIHHTYGHLRIRMLMRYYKQYIQKALMSAQATIEYTGILAPEALQSVQTFFNQYYKRTLHFNILSASGLIAGIRVSIADDIWEVSVAQTLNTFKQIYNYSVA